MKCWPGENIACHRIYPVVTVRCHSVQQQQQEEDGMPEQERQTAVTLGIMRDIITEVRYIWWGSYCIRLGMVVIDFPCCT